MELPEKIDTAEIIVAGDPSVGIKPHYFRITGLALNLDTIAKMDQKAYVESARKELVEAFTNIYGWDCYVQFDYEKQQEYLNTLDALPLYVEVWVGAMYINRKGEHVTITTSKPSNHDGWPEFRFRDTKGRLYTANGGCKKGRKYDLVLEGK